MAAAGCALVYGAVILLGLDHATLPDSDGYFPTICTVSLICPFQNSYAYYINALYIRNHEISFNALGHLACDKKE